MQRVGRVFQQQLSYLLKHFNGNRFTFLNLCIRRYGELKIMPIVTGQSSLGTSSPSSHAAWTWLTIMTYIVVVPVAHRLHMAFMQTVHATSSSRN